MSALEVFYLRGAAAVALAYLGFFCAVTEGGVPADLSRNAILAVLLGYGLGLAAVLSALWVLALKTDGADRARADEREALIEAKADRTGYHVLDAGLLTLTVVIVLEIGMGEAIGPWRLDRPATLVLALVSLSDFAGVARMMAGFRAARRG